MGRSTGVQVNAVTRSGTNQLSGLFRSNFRDSRFNAENRVLDRVEPINNQQYSVAVGGPIMRDRLHLFANYEYEREPRTAIWRTPYTSFNIGIEGTNTQKKGGVRLDYQLSPGTRVMGKVSGAANLGAVRRDTGTQESTIGQCLQHTNAQYRSAQVGLPADVLTHIDRGSYVVSGFRLR